MREVRVPFVLLVALAGDAVAFVLLPWLGAALALVGLVALGFAWGHLLLSYGHAKPRRGRLVWRDDFVKRAAEHTRRRQI